MWGMVRMHRYIDFDGVILDTSPLLFKRWREMEHETLNETDKIAYIKEQDWVFILDNSPVINGSLDVLKQLDIERNSILTTVHSLENEGVSKVKYLRKNGVWLPVILVPYVIDKAQMVDAKNNILIDDRIHNLEVWQQHGGHSVFFNKNNLDFDEWHQVNIKYPKIRTLNDINKMRNRK